jgi:Zn finger protein HypA/HybF involved in hydrogenase expression
MNPFGSSGPHMRDKYAAKAPLVSGETVAPGEYRCCECEYDLKIERGIVNLPVCPRCQGERWELR